jgi:hypothetical protein
MIRRCKMAWRVVDCEVRDVPWTGEVEGELYWVLLKDVKTGKEMEFELFDGIYYGSEDEELEEPLEYIEVIIDGAVDFSEIFPSEERSRVFRELRGRYGDVINAINTQCKEFSLDI